jgi:riboflavin synthase
LSLAIPDQAHGSRLKIMFTGIIQAVGRIATIEPKAGDTRLHIATGGLDLSDVRPGDSIAVSGVCLTATTLAGDGFWADVSGETLARTNLATLRVGDRVNLEKALTLATRLGGHLVSGHVDGVAEVLDRRVAARSVQFRVQSPAPLARYIATKGSVCLDGVSLTVNAVDGPVFYLNVVPHTLAATTLDEWRAGRRVNLEVDLIARYLERLLHGERAAPGEDALTREFLAQHGFLED